MLLEVLEGAVRCSGEYFDLVHETQNRSRRFDVRGRRTTVLAGIGLRQELDWAHNLSDTTVSATISLPLLLVGD